MSAEWHILGAGAVGTLLRGACDGAGVSAQLLTHRAVPERRTLRDDEATSAYAVQPLRDLAPRSVRHLLLTTKAYALGAALRGALPWLHRDAIVLTCANGRGFEAELRELLGPRPLFHAVTTEAALREDREHVRRTGRGITLAGRGQAEVEQPSWFTDSLGLLRGWRWTDDIEQAIDDKFAINCAINPLTALHQCRNGELVENTAYRLELQSLCAEIEAVLRALRRWPAEASLFERASAVCAATAANRSSMLQDRERGSRGELAYLNGHLRHLAADAGVSAPDNAALCAALEPILGAN